MNWKVILGIAISAGLLALLLYAVDPRALLLELRSVDPGLLLVGIGLYFVGALVRAARWRLILRPVRSVPLRRALSALLIGFTANDLLPARVGELVRAFLLQRSHRVPFAATIASIVVERVLDGLMLCAFILVGWLALPAGGWIWQLGWLGSVVFVVGLAALWVAAHPPEIVARASGRLVDRLPERLGGRLRGVSGTFATGLGILRRPGLLLRCLVLSLAAWLLEASMYFVIALAFRLPVGPLAALLGVGAANLGTMIPGAPGYVGTFDVPLVAVLTLLFGVSKEAAIGYTLVVHAALVVPVVLVGLLLVWQEGLSLRSVARSPYPAEGPASRRESPAARAVE